MKAVVFIWCCIMLNSVKAQDALPAIRSLYSAAGIAHDSSEALNNLLASVNDKSAAVLVCYKGAARMISAKYTHNPLKKYSAFVKGKKLVEAAVARDSSNIEIRFLRFTIQTNLPGFLNYHDNINSDKQYIFSHYHFVNNPALRHLIVNYFKVSGCCTESDIKNLRDD